MSEFIDQANDNLEKMQELNLLKKAVPNAQKLKQFAFSDNENLIRQIMMIYPEATNIVMVNLDKRDGLGIPTISTKQIRAMYVCQTSYSGKRTISSQNFDSYQIMLCLIENNIVSVKVINRKWGDSVY
jgi:hypothetical protein